MTDPRDFNRMGMDNDPRVGAPAPWGWIAGAVFVIVVLALIFTTHDGTRTAQDTSPPATTGMAPRPAPTMPPAGPTPPAQSR
jgi:hypothetical protein